jgi:hypothetical protein
VDLTGNGASGLPAWATTFLPICGWTATGSTYAAVKTTGTTATIELYEDGLKRQMVGCRGTFRLRYTAGKGARVAFDIQGCFTGETDVAILAPTFPTVIPPVWKSGTCTINSVAQKLSTLEIDAGNDVIMREDPAASTGYRAAEIVGRKPTITLDPEAVTVATQGWRTARDAGTEWALSVILGSAANNIITVASSKFQARQVGRGSRNGLSTHAITGQLNSATPFSIALT